jgi:hypothetical protein
VEGRAPRPAARPNGHGCAVLCVRCVTASHDLSALVTCLHGRAQDRTRIKHGSLASESEHGTGSKCPRPELAGDDTVTTCAASRCGAKSKTQPSIGPSGRGPFVTAELHRTTGTRKIDLFRVSDGCASLLGEAGEAVRVRVVLAALCAVCRRICASNVRRLRARCESVCRARRRHAGEFWCARQCSQCRAEYFSWRSLCPGETIGARWFGRRSMSRSRGERSRSTIAATAALVELRLSPLRTDGPREGEDAYGVAGGSHERIVIRPTIARRPVRRLRNPPRPERCDPSGICSYASEAVRAGRRGSVCARGAGAFSERRA